MNMVYIFIYLGLFQFLLVMVYSFHCTGFKYLSFKLIPKLFSFFGHMTCGILVPQPGIEPILPTLEA